MAIITGLNFAGTPGYDYRLLVKSSGIDLTKLSNRQYMNYNNISRISLNITIKLRTCITGEYFTTGG